MSLRTFIGLMAIGIAAFMTGCGGGGSSSTTVATHSLPIANGTVQKRLTLNLSTPPTEIAGLGTFTITSSASNAITFDAADGNLCDDVLYDRRIDNFNFDGLYRARGAGRDYFFRFGWQDCSGPATKFTELNWVNDAAAPAGTYQFSVVSKEREQTGTKTLTMIGDSITWWSQGEAFRVLLAERRSDYNYTGSRTDTFGFHHDGEGGNGTPQVLARIANIPVSDAYWLLIGTNDVATAPTLSNIQAIVDGLLAKNTAATVYVGTLLPRADATKDARNRGVSAEIRNWIGTAGDARLRLIDYDQALRGNPQWLGLLVDGLHPSAAGYTLLVDLTAAALQ